MASLNEIRGAARADAAVVLAGQLADQTPVAVYGTAVMGELTAGLDCPDRGDAGFGIDLVTCEVG
ncbi:hypothetical protein [Propionicimonas sp.]|uniref:hypothetical protein n=1 Tax=Propionicimonas sp. TaxID=1955623 RepID=UPI0039E359F7